MPTIPCDFASSVPRHSGGGGPGGREAGRAGATGRSSRRRARAGPDARQRTHPHHGRAKHRREHGDHPQRPLLGGRQCGAARAAPPATQVIDLRGRTVVPGLIDTHLHGLDTADRPGYHALDVESATSIREVQDVLAAHRKTVPEGQWITAIGAAHPNLWSEHRFPTLKELDDAVPDRPVLLYQGFNGAAATNTLGKKFFDAADAAPPLHPDYKGVHVSETGAIGDVHRRDRRPVHERAVPAAPAAEVRRQEAECAPHDGVFHERRPDRMARQIDHLCAGTAASASGLGERRPLPVPRRLECGPHRRPDVDARADGLHGLRRAR